MQCVFCSKDNDGPMMQAHMCGFPVVVCPDHLKLTWSEKPQAVEARYSVLKAMEAPARILNTARAQLRRTREADCAAVAEAAWKLVNDLPLDERGGEEDEDQGPTEADWD